MIKSHENSELSTGGHRLRRSDSSNRSSGSTLILERHDGWVPASQHELPASGALRVYQDLISNCDNLARLCDAAIQQGEPSIASDSAGQLVSVTPLQCNGVPQVAVGITKGDTESLLQAVRDSQQRLWQTEQQLLAAQRKITSQEVKLDRYVEQVSEDLEELTWLRTLASHLELSESNNSTERIAEAVLPTLSRLTRACTVALIRDVPLSQTEQNLPIVWQTGRVRVPTDTCLRLVAELGATNGDQPVVRNDCAQMFVQPGFPGIDACVIVPVATSTSRIGWLLAINKEPAQEFAGRTVDRADSSTHMSEQEFGTFEATLLSATAVVLAAYGRNCAMFNEKESLLRGVIRSLINAIDAKDSYTCGHSDRVADFSRLIARRLGLSSEECERIYMTGLLHDVGKIGVPDDILQKPGRLTEAEFEQIKRHPVIGYEILKHLDNLDYVLPGVMHHHEAIDGSGYPHQLRGEQIPLAARILAVADAYDAMTSNRPYRRGMPTEKAESILRAGAGTQWDTNCIEAFFSCIAGIRLIAQQTSAPLSHLN